MTNRKMIRELLQELTEYQQKRVLNVGKQIVPNLTYDDILQPNDFPQLESNAIFRYEEGILAGIQTVDMALKRLEKEESFE